MVKYVRHFEALYLMVQALASSLRILCWASILLAAVQAVTAFILTESLYSFYFNNHSVPVQERLEVFVYYGSFVRALLTTFEMTMANWPAPARVLFENVSEWFVVVCVAHKLIVGFAVIGVINAVFVQETFQVAMTDDLAMILKKEKTMRMQRSKLDKLFRVADKDGDERINREQFKSILRSTEVKLWLASMDYDANDPDQLFDLMDVEQHGDLSCVEFLQGMARLRGQAKAMDLIGLRKEQREMRKSLQAMLRGARRSRKSQASFKPILSSESGVQGIPRQGVSH